jgi:probable O-glycosylation ligase (exosortase A-associated)
LLGERMTAVATIGRGGELSASPRRSPGIAADVLGGVAWTPSLVALLYYTFAVTTFHAPGAKWAMIACLLGLTAQPHQLRWHPVLSWMAAFVGWCFLSSVVNDNSASSWDVANAIGKVALVCFAGYNTLQSRAQIKFFLWFCAAIFLAYPVRGTFVLYLSGITIWGRAFWAHTYSNPNDLAAFALLFLSVMMAFAALSANRTVRWGTLAGAAATALVILLTQSRGAFLALIVTIAIALWLAPNRRRSFLIMVVVGFVLVPFVPKSAWARFKGLLSASTESGMRDVDKEGSAAQRFQIMQIAWIIAKDHPIMGVGPGMYREVHRRYATQRASEFDLAAGEKDSHSTYLQIASELGFVGLFLFLGMIGSTLTSALREAKRRVTTDLSLGLAISALSLGLVAYLVSGFFLSGGYLNMLYLSLCITASAVSLPHLQSRPLPRATLVGDGPQQHLTRGMRGGAVLGVAR